MSIADNFVCIAYFFKIIIDVYCLLRIVKTIVSNYGNRLYIRLVSYFCNNQFVTRDIFDLGLFAK